MSGSQANSVALKPAGTFSGGKRFSVCGPVRASSSARSKTTLERAAMQVVSGTVQDVRYSRGKNGEVTGIHFRLPQATSELVYMSFYPSFEDAKRCILPGAHIVARVLPTDPSAPATAPERHQGDRRADPTAPTPARTVWPSRAGRAGRAPR